MAALIAAMVIWGSIGAVLLWSGLSAVEASFYRCVFGALCLLPYCLWRGDFKRHYFHPKQLLLVLLGGVLIVANWVLLFASFRLASITLGNVSYYLQPVFLVLLGLVFFKERVSAMRWFFIALTVVGVLLTVNLHPSDMHWQGATLLGVLAAVSAGLLYAFATIIAKQLHDYPASLMTWLQLLLGSVLLLPMVHSGFAKLGSPQLLSYMLVLGVVHTALAYVLYYSGVKRLSVTVVAVLSYVDPIVAILSDVAFFHRHLYAIQWFGIALTMLASYWVIRTPKRSSDLPLVVD